MSTITDALGRACRLQLAADLALVKAVAGRIERDAALAEALAMVRREDLQPLPDDAGELRP